MATDTTDSDGARSIDHLRLEDGTYVLYDPSVKRAWVECETPVDLAAAT